jgi:hypothetical protein
MRTGDPRFRPAVDHRTAIQLPLAQDEAAALLDLPRGRGMDHDQSGGRDLFMPRLDAGAGQVAVHADLCTAAPGRRASARLGCSSTKPMTMGNAAARRPHNQVIAHDLPGRLALAANGLDREQEL